jgi:hypothetical protein
MAQQEHNLQQVLPIKAQKLVLALCAHVLQDIERLRKV